MAMAVVSCGVNKPAVVVEPTGTTLITIDSAGVVPSFDGTSTSSVIYVHNNSNVTINDISYTVQNNLNSQKPFLDAASIVACRSIAAGGACPLIFATPEINSLKMQGSTVLTATYTVKNYNNNQANSFSQVINYRRVAMPNVAGVRFSSGLLLSGAGNPMAYGVLYLYSAGGDQSYRLNNFLSSESRVNVLQESSEHKPLVANSVYHVEVSAAVTDVINNTESDATNASSQENQQLNQELNSHGFYANLTATSSFANSSPFVSTANLGIKPASSGAVLIAGLVPVIDSSVANPTGSMYVVNMGNTLASISGITFPIGIIRSGGTNDCGTTLASGANCVIYFRLPPDGGNGNIIVSYDDSKLSQSITWYGSTTDPLLSMSSDAGLLSFATGSDSVSVTVTNIGGNKLIDVAASAVTTRGNAITNTTKPICKDKSNNSTGTNLELGGSCSYQAIVSDNKIEAGSIDLGFSGNFADGSSASYRRILAMDYNSMLHGASRHSIESN